MTANTFTLLVDGADYYTATTADGKACVGMIGHLRMDFPPTHAIYSEVLAVTDEAGAEALFDKYAARYL